jgi:hypothetical protein
MEVLKRTFTFLLAILAIGAAAQDADVDSVLGTITLSELDLTEATISQAGPTSFYVRSVGIDDALYSLLIESSTSGVWSVTSIVPESSNVLPPDAILDFATISVVDDTIQIDGVLVGSNAYSGTLSVGTDAGLSLAGSISSGSFAVNEARAAALAALVAAETQAAFDEELQEQIEFLEETIDRIEAQRDTYKDERDALRVERDSLATDVVSTGSENNQLREENDSLESQIAELQELNAKLQDDITTMTAEVTRLQQLVQEEESDGGESTIPTTDTSADTTTTTEETTGEESEAAETTPSTWTMPGDYLRRSDLEAAAVSVTNELKTLSDRVAALEAAATDLASLEATIREGLDRLDTLSAAGSMVTPSTTATESETETTPAAESAETPADSATAGAEDGTREAGGTSPEAEADQALQEVRERLARLRAEAEELEAERQAIEERVLDEILSNGFVELMKERLTRQVVSGFGDADPDTGEWTLFTDWAVQNDAEAYFAKLAMPAAQGSDPVLYSFRVRSVGTGWVGVGLHLFVSDVERRLGYGMGRSLLVWLTRDPEVRKNELTYLQLYRSDDDINMGRVLDASIPESLGDFLQVDVLYEPETQYLTVAVNGEDRIRYRTWFGINSGLEIALRTLGRAEFRDFSVHTAP